MPRTKNRRWKEKIDFSDGEITTADKLYAQERREQLLIPQTMQMLRRMVDGRQDPYMNQYYPGDGSVRLNCLGGFGYGRETRKMVKKGWITIYRSQGNQSCHGGSNTINTTIATITDQGRIAYADWKKRMKGRI